MSELVADCPRCGAKHITLDLKGEQYIGRSYGWQYWFEAFCVCRKCHRSSIFILAQNTDARKDTVHDDGLLNLSSAVNNYMKVEGIITLADCASVPPPEHLPKDIESSFSEASRCLAIGCWTAAGSMFRKCIDLATRPLLPEDETEGLNARTRRDLGLRLPWLHKNGFLTDELFELSDCIREDGNDAAHLRFLKKEDAEDLLDFTTALLERVFTQPARIDLAKQRREDRRNAN